ncbi:MAG: NAD(P)-dependent oxidoreductase [Anaerolineae bacterium]|nr:NAD(P)-dependent oxidoreductase [Anaerolineae bacterium]
MRIRKVVVTGAAGRMAGLILADLRARYDLVALDVRTTDDEGRVIPDVQTIDLLNEDRSAYRAHFRGADAVLHFGFVRTPDQTDVDSYFKNEMHNVQMAYNVYQAAWEEQVRRVVMVSSNHAADYFEPLILDGKWDFVNPNDRPLSDNFYGWTKAVYEHLGFVFAAGTLHDRPLENVQIRIGGPRETDVANAPLGDLRRVRRALAVYLSQRDMAQLFIKSIETEDIRDEFGVPFQIFYGISNNSHAFWSIANARKIIGYEPQDNSEIRFKDLIDAHIRAAQEKGEHNA